ncbi:MAG TPA: methyltransferase domain-containing protein, partial [Ornithinibacter sp.]|nr:methyltransferase domain-containing protein [Ornithinibacter sp.]
MRVDEPGLLDQALWRARESAFPPGEFVGQESFVTATEVLALAARAGIAPGVSVLDLCCGVAGPGLHVTRELGCTYLGVDASPRAIARARQRAADGGLGGARFDVAAVPPVPQGPFDVVLLLETLLAFPDKPALLRGVRSALVPGGRFAFTLEEGAPLTEAERRVMPAADTVWLTALPDLLADVERTGLRVRWYAECSRA